ncbi:hypothetical protein SODG_005856 [Sodalis praecaptivus]
MKHDFSDVVPENFYTTDGHINLDALVTREEHLYALSIAQRALAGIEEQLASSVGVAMNGNIELTQRIRDGLG